MANLLKRHEFWLGMFIIALCLLLGWRSEEFFTFGNLYDLANNYAMLTILACGLFVVLIAGGIDISFPAMTIIAQYGMVVMLQKVGGTDERSHFIGALLALAPPSSESMPAGWHLAS